MSNQLKETKNYKAGYKELLCSLDYIDPTFDEILEENNKKNGTEKLD